jgi:hypothetical protein
MTKIHSSREWSKEAQSAAIPLFRIFARCEGPSSLRRQFGAPLGRRFDEAGADFPRREGALCHGARHRRSGTTSLCGFVYYCCLRPHTSLGNRTPLQAFLGEASADLSRLPRGRKGETAPPLSTTTTVCAAGFPSLIPAAG